MAPWSNFTTIGGIIVELSSLRFVEMDVTNDWLCTYPLLDSYYFLIFTLNQFITYMRRLQEQFAMGSVLLFMMYLIYVADGESKTSHYSIATGFMALGMMLPEC
jgi:hypothetical protein